MKNKLFVVFISLFMYANCIFAWNKVGHQVVAEIAYANLSPQARKNFSNYNKLLNLKGRKYSVIDASFWLDTLYADNKYRDFYPLHYINLPLALDASTVQPVNSYNAVFAVKITQAMLQDSAVSILDKALAWRILWHVVADLHQPMHAINAFSKQFPQGDEGGNLVVLPKNRVAKNLHSYWDRAGGLLFKKKRFKPKEIKLLAQQINKKWPCSSLDNVLEPGNWAQESYNLAAKYAYTDFNNPQYAKICREVTLQRLAVAGCRLAALGDIVGRDVINS